MASKVAFRVSWDRMIKVSVKLFQTVNKAVNRYFRRLIGQDSTIPFVLKGPGATRFGSILAGIFVLDTGLTVSKSFAQTFVHPEKTASPPFSGKGGLVAAGCVPRLQSLQLETAAIVSSSIFFLRQGVLRGL